MEIDLEKMSEAELESLRKVAVARARAARGELEVLEDYIIKRKISGVITDLQAKGLFNGQAT